MTVCQDTSHSFLTIHFTFLIFVMAKFSDNISPSVNYLTNVTMLYLVFYPVTI